MKFIYVCVCLCVCMHARCHLYYHCLCKLAFIKWTPSILGSQENSPYLCFSRAVFCVLSARNVCKPKCIDDLDRKSSKLYILTSFKFTETAYVLLTLSFWPEFFNVTNLFEFKVLVTFLSQISATLHFFPKMWLEVLALEWVRLRFCIPTLLSLTLNELISESVLPKTKTIVIAQGWCEYKWVCRTHAQKLSNKQ